MTPDFACKLIANYYFDCYGVRIHNINKTDYAEMSAELVINCAPYELEYALLAALNVFAFGCIPIDDSSLKPYIDYFDTTI